ncbi:MAG TPA: DUF4258 domain-containing protein [Bdellovibrionota bacterium]|nr:DUF4258 domain-containing protein [Bdellovibrionota bacterium]
MAVKGKRPPKIDEKQLLQFLDSRPPVNETHHGEGRVLERGIYMADVRNILWGELPRWREPSRDRWEPLLGKWSYSFRGKDRDGQELRIVIAIDEGVLLVTVYNPAHKGERV